MTLNERAARTLSRIPSVFLRLIVSYIVLVSLVASIVAGVSYLYFKSIYEKELDRFHELYLKNIEKELSNQVVDTAKLVYMELDSLLAQRDGDLFSPEDRLADNASKVYSTYRFLNDLVARNYDRIEAIDIYYVREGLLISSSGFNADGTSVLHGDGRAWLDHLITAGSRSSWVAFRRPAYLGVPAMTLLRSMRCFPILSNPEDCSAIVCMDFREKALRDIMDRLSPGDGGSTVLVANDSLDRIGTRQGENWDAGAELSLRETLRDEGGRGSTRLVGSGGRQRLLSILPLSDSGWSVANLVPASLLYRKGQAISLVTAAICVVSIGLGAIVAAFVASGIYNPLEGLLARLRALFGLALPQRDFQRDEYRLIDDALSGISTKMGELAATVEANRPIIRHELMLRFLEGDRMEPEEIRGTLDLLGLGGLPGTHRALIFTLPRGPSGEGQTEDDRRILKYHIADELARQPGIPLTSALPGDRIGVVAEAGDGGESAFDVRLAGWVSSIEGYSGVKPQAAAGPPVLSLEDLSESFETARRLAEYHFLFPDIPVLIDRPDLLSRAGRSAAPEKDFDERLSACLRARDIDRFRSLLELYKFNARSGDCQIQACRAELDGFGLVVTDFVRELLIPSAQSLEKSLAELLTESACIDGYLDELVGAAVEACASAGSPQSKRYALLVERIKSYVAANLSADLSLDGVGKAVAVSPGYMGKIFREETGRSLVSYVTELRLSEAARRLLESRDPIQEIGRSVGFNTSAYFIRLFKDRYGSTPLDYRRAKLGR